MKRKQMKEMGNGEKNNREEEEKENKPEKY